MGIPAHRRRSIAFRITVALVSVTVLILAARVLLLYVAARERYRTDLRAAAAVHAEQAAIALELPIWNIDRSQIERVISSVLRDPEIWAVSVEAAGAVHAVARDAAWVPVRVASVAPAAGLVRQDHEVRTGRSEIGRVTLWLSPRFADERLRGDLAHHAAGALLIAVFLIGALWGLLRRIVLQPLRALERYAQAVSSGERPGPASIGAGFEGELETLWSSLQGMVALLDARYAQLELAQASIHALVARVQQVREEEKVRIARDLHDDLGQLLTAVQMELQRAEEWLAERAEDPVANELTDRVVEAARLAGDAARSVHRIAADLRPSALDRLGLGAALRHEGRSFLERGGIPCVVELHEELPEIDGDAATTIFRIAQEALTNVARHAQASRATVALGREGDWLTLRVEDDGRGMPDPGDDPLALGLLGMRERAQKIGGSVRISRGGERGTVVELRAPLARVARTPAKGPT
jgi:signal transduction histidine kinase